MIQDTIGTGQLHIPCTTTSRMVYCYAVTTYSVTTNATKVTSQSEALEIAMRLEASPMSESTLEMDQL